MYGQRNFHKTLRWSNTSCRIRCVPHEMQELLKKELDKLCKEKILHKVDIAESLEWLNIFLCQKAKWQNKAMLRPTHLNR